MHLRSHLPTRSSADDVSTLNMSTHGGSAYEKRGWDPLWLAKALEDPKRPVFLMGCTPPREGTSPGDAISICRKFVDRSRANATDGFIVYDIQDESSRNSEARPFPFRRTLDPVEFASIFPRESGKSVVVYKVPVESNIAEFDSWLTQASISHGHRTFNLVGPASSADGATRVSLAEAAGRVAADTDLAFGCVTIAERHLKKGTEHLNILRKTALGAKWFISQAVYDAEATVRLLHDYAAECKRRGEAPRKIILTFAPAGRPKTLQFCKWLGINVPEAVEARVLAKAAVSKEAAVAESVDVCSEILREILQKTAGCDVPLGVSVESVSGFKEEIDGAFELFRRLQQIMLDSKGQAWGVRWFRVPVASLAKTSSEEALLKFEAREAAKHGYAAPAAAPAADASSSSSSAAAPIPSSGGSSGGSPAFSHGRGSSRMEQLALVAAGVAIGMALARATAATR
jgi:hypothetical protein